MASRLGKAGEVTPAPRHAIALDLPTTIASFIAVVISFALNKTGDSLYGELDKITYVYMPLSLLILLAPPAVGALARGLRGRKGPRIAFTWIACTFASLVLIAALMAVGLPFADPPVYPFYVLVEPLCWAFETAARGFAAIVDALFPSFSWFVSS